MGDIGDLWLQRRREIDFLLLGVKALKRTQDLAKLRCRLIVREPVDFLVTLLVHHGLSKLQVYRRCTLSVIAQEW